MIYILRHGQTDMNRKHVLQSRSDYPLNEEGVRQALAAGERLKGIPFRRVYSSPLRRAVQTAELAVPGVPLTTDERLIEMDYGPYEGMDLRAPAPEFLTFFSDFARNPAPEGVEPLESVVRRAGSFMEEAEKEGDILVSTHAIAMKGILEYLMPESRGSWWSRNIGNCAVFVTEYRNGAFSSPQEF